MSLTMASLQTILMWKCHGITIYHFQVSSLWNSKFHSGNQFQYLLDISMMEMECIFLWSLPVEMLVEICFPLHFVCSHQSGVVQSHFVNKEWGNKIFESHKQWNVFIQTKQVWCLFCQSWPILIGLTQTDIKVRRVTGFPGWCCPPSPARTDKWC